MTEYSGKRLDGIDAGKGIAIMMVVYHHIVSGGPYLITNEPFYFIYTIIRLVDVSFFYLLAGMTFSVSCRRIKGSNYPELFKFIGAKVQRLLPAYFTLVFILTGLVFIFGYLLNKESTGVTEILNYILYPKKAQVWYLYFVHLLILYYIVFALLLNLIKNRILVICLSLGVFFMPDTEFLNLNTFRYNYIFFLLGVLAIEYYQIFIKYLNNYYFIIVTCAISSIAIYCNSPFIISVSGVLALCYLAFFTKLNRLQFLRAVGECSFSIYLFNLFFIVAIKLLAVEVLHFDINSIAVFSPAMFLCGLLGPFIFKKYVFSKNKSLDKYF